MRECKTNDELVDLVKYRAESYLGRGPRDGRVLAAMRRVDRASFLPPSSRAGAYFDEAADIGSAQTCSQPSMVAFMLDKLEPLPGHRALEVGAGCGYAAAILALLVAPSGSVLAAEILDELATAARANCAVALSRAGDAADLLEIAVADASAGIPGRGPFDRILVSAGVRRGRFKEEKLLAKLAEGGVLVYPEALGKLYRITRRGDGLVRESWGMVAFVPLVGNNA
jgi:protein-L-isoaspartate(D-aspartate) O-methyltransferase